MQAQRTRLSYKERFRMHRNSFVPKREKKETEARLRWLRKSILMGFEAHKDIL